MIKLLLYSLFNNRFYIFLYLCFTPFVKLNTYYIIIASQGGPSISLNHLFIIMLDTQSILNLIFC